MKQNKRFIKFLTDLKTAGQQKTLIEAVERGYRILCEADERERIADFGQDGQVVLYDSRRGIGTDEVVDFCDANDIEVPAEDSDKWYDICNELREIESDDFRMNSGHIDLGYCLVHGYAGLWNGNADGGKLMDIDDGSDLLSCVRGCDDVKVVIDKDDGLVVYGYHHDGTNRYVIDQVTDAGVEHVNNYEGDVDDRELHEELINTPGMLKKIDFWIF